MPSPFPGMDPYLEGYLWPDVHSALANSIRRQLTPQLRPRYTARLEIYTVEDDAPESEIGIMYPDVEVVFARRPPATPQPQMGQTTSAQAANGAHLVAPLTLPLLPIMKVKVVNVEIRNAGDDQLVTSIELLSPVNKREPGLALYRAKRRRLMEAGIHLIEVDLLRRGTRSFIHPKLPPTAYVVTLTRAPAKVSEAWPLTLQSRLPTIPVPLRQPDEDVTLDLQVALAEVYEEAAYDLSLDYTENPPPPPLSKEDAAWMHELLRQG